MTWWVIIITHRTRTYPAALPPPLPRYSIPPIGSEFNSRHDDSTSNSFPCTSAFPMRPFPYLSPVFLFRALLPPSSVSLRLSLFSSTSNTKLNTSNANSGYWRHMARKLPSVSCRSTWERCPQNDATGLRMVKSSAEVWLYT